MDFFGDEEGGKQADLSEGEEGKKRKNNHGIWYK
jgi:hypothetical protein